MKASVLLASLFLGFAEAKNPRYAGFLFNVPKFWVGRVRKLFRYRCGNWLEEFVADEPGF